MSRSSSSKTTISIQDSSEEEEVTIIEPKRKWYQQVWQFVKPPPCPWSAGSYIRLCIVLLVICALISGIIFRKNVAYFLGEKGPLARFVKEIGWWGPVVFAAVYVLCTVLFIPGTALTLAAGIIFPELYVAVGTVIVGSNVGAQLAFLLGKTGLRSWVSRKVEKYPTFQAIDAAVGKRGIFMVFLLRLSPIIPFNLLNYSLALTAVNFPSYAVASFFGMLPGTFLYVYIPWAGARAASTQGTANLVKNILIYGVGSVVTIGVVVFVTILARRAVKKAMLELEEERALLEQPEEQP